MDEVIEAVEVDVGEELAGKVADGEATFVVGGGEEVVAGEVFDARFLVVAVVDDRVEQPKGGFTFDFSAEQLFENVVIDAGEVFANVALEDVAVGACPVGELMEGFVGTEADSIGVGVVDEGLLEEGSDDVAEGVVDDTVTIGGGGDQSVFGREDLEGAVGSGLVGLAEEFLLELNEFGFEVVVEVEDVGAETFAPLSFFGGEEQGFKLGDLGPEVSVALHESCLFVA